MDTKRKAFQRDVSNLKDVAPAPLSDVIYEQLRMNILDGVLRPGQALRQEELAKNARISRVPLREALSRLEADGLILRRPRRGYIVNSLEPSDIVEILELRAVIEEHAATIAARARTPDEITEAGRLLESMDALEPVDESTFGDWLKFHYDFHSHIIASSHRPRILRIANSLRDSVEAYIRVEVLMTGQLYDANNEHHEIFEAFRAGDAAGLARLSREHVQNTSRRLLTKLRQNAVRNSPVAPAPSEPVRSAQISNQAFIQAPDNTSINDSALLAGS